MAEGRRIRGDFHIHSRYSYDSNIPPEAILRKASELGMNAVSITDHETMRGSLEARKLAPRYSIEVWPGMEIATTAGDVIGIGLREEVRARDWEEVIDEIRDQGGTAILPHPFRGHRTVDELAARVDLIEVFNGHDRPENVVRSAELARQHGKPGIAGSDAHVLSEIGNAINEFDDLMSPEKEYITRSSNRFERTCSYLIKDVKRMQYHRIPLDMTRFFR